MNDRVKPLQIARRHIAHVLSDGRHVHNGTAFFKEAMFVKADVIAGHFMPRIHEDRYHDRSDIALIARNQYFHVRLLKL